MDLPKVIERWRSGDQHILFDLASGHPARVAYFIVQGRNDGLLSDEDCRLITKILLDQYLVSLRIADGQPVETEALNVLDWIEPSPN